MSIESEIPGITYS